MPIKSFIQATKPASLDFIMSLSFFQCFLRVNQYLISPHGKFKYISTCIYHGYVQFFFQDLNDYVWIINNDARKLNINVVIVLRRMIRLRWSYRINVGDSGDWKGRQADSSNRGGVRAASLHAVIIKLRYCTYAVCWATVELGFPSKCRQLCRVLPHCHAPSSGWICRHGEGNFVFADDIRRLHQWLFPHKIYNIHLVLYGRVTGNDFTWWP